MPQELLYGDYAAFSHNCSTNYSMIRRFKFEVEILFSTDNGAKGFNLVDSAFVIRYGLLYNTLKTEPRIRRCHRLGQESGGLSVAFIDRNIFADVRRLELAKKRMLVSDVAFGITDDVLGGFTDGVKMLFPVIALRLWFRAQIEQANKVKIIPKYIERRERELNNDFGAIAKWFFSRYDKKTTIAVC